MNIQKQRGVVLIVCLVILAIVTVLGVTAVESTGLEMKMAANTQQQQAAFNAAETTLRQVEFNISDVGYSRADLQDDCVGVDCFDSTCTKGLCFAGTWAAADFQKDCDRYGGTPPVVQVWEDPALDVWNDASKHETVAITGNTSDGQYIVEFLCFIDAPVGSGEVDTDTGDALYRITAVGTSESGRSRVMVQSTYHVPTP